MSQDCRRVVRRPFCAAANAAKSGQILLYHPRR